MFARSARISSAARRDTQRAAGRWGWHCHLSPSRLPPSPAPNEHLGAAPGVQGFLLPGSGTNPARHEGSGGSAGSSAGLHPLTCRQRGAHTAVYPGVMRSHSPPQGTRALHRLSSNRGTAASNRCPRFAPLRPRAAQRPTASSSATPTAAPSPAAPPQPRVGPGQPPASPPLPSWAAFCAGCRCRRPRPARCRRPGGPPRRPSLPSASEGPPPPPGHGRLPPPGAAPAGRSGDGDRGRGRREGEGRGGTRRGPAGRCSARGHREEGGGRPPEGGSRPEGQPAGLRG